MRRIVQVHGFRASISDVRQPPSCDVLRLNLTVLDFVTCGYENGVGKNVRFDVARGAFADIEMP